MKRFSLAWVTTVTPQVEEWHDYSGVLVKKNNNNNNKASGRVLKNVRAHSSLILSLCRWEKQRLREA